MTCVHQLFKVIFKIIALKGSFNTSSNVTPSTTTKTVLGHHHRIEVTATKTVLSIQITKILRQLRHQKNLPASNLLLPSPLTHE